VTSINLTSINRRGYYHQLYKSYNVSKDCFSDVLKS